MRKSAIPSKKAALMATASVAVAALLLTGCGRTDSVDDAPTASIDTKPATGTIEFWAGGSGGGEGDALPAYLEKFKAENPDVTINVTSIPSNEFDAKLIAAITSRSVPDMVFLYTQTQQSQFATGGFSPVPKDLVDSSSFFESAYNSTLVNGVSYAVPWYTYAQVLYYRSDLAAKAGVKAPTTWEETIEFAKALKKSGVEYPFSLDVGWDAYSAQGLTTYAAQNGGSFISADNKSWTINTKENVEALEYWSNLIKDGYASPDGPGFLDTVPYFSSGKIAGLYTGPWFPGFLKGANESDPNWIKDHVGTVIPPAGKAGSFAPVGGGSLAVLKDAKNAEAAWKLARWMSTPQAQSDWYDHFGNLPAVTSAWSMNTTISNDPLLAPVKDAIPTGITGPMVPTWAQVGAIIGQQMERVARGNATAQEALDEAQAQAEAIGTGAK